MLLLIAASSIALEVRGVPKDQEKVAPGAAVEAQATVRVVDAARASREAWERVPPFARRQVIMKGEGGEAVLLRLVEFQ